MTITGHQIRAARAYLDWTRIDLAKHSGVSRASIQNFETGATDIRLGNMAKLIAAFAKHGLSVEDDGGIVRTKSDSAVSEFDG